MRARPCPTFGRPVRHWGGPLRLRPGTSPHALRIPPRGGHPALQRTTSGGSRFALAVSGFRLRARVGFSIPSALSGRRGITPVFGYGAPHSSAEGTSTLLTSALPSAHYEPVRPPLPVHHRRTASAFPARPAPLRRASRGSPGSRAWNVHACMGSPTVETIHGKRGISIAASEIARATATHRVLVSSRRYLIRRAALTRIAGPRLREIASSLRATVRARGRFLAA